MRRLLAVDGVIGKLFWIVWLLCPRWVFAFAPSESEILHLGVGLSETVRVARLARVAVGNGKVARARSPAPNTLLITGLRAGETLIRAWDLENHENVYLVKVVAAELDPSLQHGADREVIQVSLEFLELEQAVSRSVGVHWPDAIEFRSAAQWQGMASMSGLNYTSSFQSAQGFLQLLVKNGWAKLLANPDLFVRLGEQATFQSGGEFPVPSTSENYGRFQRHIEWKPFGLFVKVRPDSGDGLHIRSDIHVEISEPNPTRGIDGIPALNRRNLDTKMNSEDGETVILSGLVRQASTSDNDRVPLLSSIPLLGALFSRKNETSEDSEILTAITLSFTTRQKERARQQRFRTRFEDWGAGQ